MTKVDGAAADLADADDANTEAMYDEMGLRAKLGPRADAVYAALRAARRATFAKVAVPTIELPGSPATTSDSSPPATDERTPATTSPGTVPAPQTTSRLMLGQLARPARSGGIEAQFLAATLGLQFSEMFANLLDKMTSAPGNSGTVESSLGDGHPTPVDDGTQTTTTSFHENLAVGAYGSVVTLRLTSEVDQTVTDDKSQAVITQVVEARSYSGKIDVCPSVAGVVPASLTSTVSIHGTTESLTDVQDLTFSGSVNDGASLTGVHVDSEDSTKWKSAGRQGTLDVKFGNLNVSGANLSTMDTSAATLSGDFTGDGGTSDTLRSAGNAGINIVLMDPSFLAAQKLWQNGRCVVVTAPDYSAETPLKIADQGNVQHTEGVEKSSDNTFNVVLRHRFGPTPIGPIDATLDGDDKIQPDHADAAPTSITYTAGDKDDAKATITLVSTSKRGRAKLLLEFQVKPKKLALQVDATVAINQGPLIFNATLHGDPTAFAAVGDGTFHASIPVTTTGSATVPNCAKISDAEVGGALVFDAKIVPGPDKKPVWQVKIDPGASSVQLNLSGCGGVLDAIVGNGGLAGAIAETVPEANFPIDGGTDHVNGVVLDVTLTATVPKQ